MKLSLFGRLTMALLASVALGLGMTACGGGTIGYMWVLGQQYNQIAGFKIDDFTGNLTTVPTSPFSAGGSMPVSIVVKMGGRFVYVIDQGTGGSIKGAGSGQAVVEYAVGGDGVLTYQDTFQTQGFVSMWAQMDSTGTFLMVLDKYAPDNSGNGAITVFSSDPNTGRLSLVTNSQTQINSLNTPYWEVGQTPIMMKVAGSCVFTLDSNQFVTPYSVGAGGQLTTVQQGGGQQLTTISATSINGNNTYVYVTDSGGGSTTNNFIYPFTIGSNCTLTSVTGGAINQASVGLSVTNPTYSMIDNSGKYLYVLNQSNTNTTSPVPFSSISAYNVSAVNGQLSLIAGSPYTVGSGPVCMVEDTSNQYVYVSNHNDGTVTGKVIDPTQGTLSNLSRGATFTASGEASCLVLSGAVS